MNCSTHNLLPAVMECSMCGKSLCKNCVKAIEEQEQITFVCAYCGGIAISPFGTTAKSDEKKNSFLGDVLGVFIYPSKGSGLFALFSAGILFIFAEIMFLYAMQIPRLGIHSSRFLGLAIAVLLLAVIFIFKYFTTVVQESSKGRTMPPSWADVELLDFDANFLEIFQAALATAASFSLPLLYYLINKQFDWAFYLLFAASLFYFPMAFLNACYYERLESLNPVPILRSIANTFSDYFVIILIFYFITASLISTQYMLMTAGRQVNGYIWVRILHRFVSLYLFLSMMHLIGIFYFHNKEKLNWG